MQFWTGEAQLIRVVVRRFAPSNLADRIRHPVVVGVKRPRQRLA